MDIKNTTQRLTYISVDYLKGTVDKISNKKNLYFYKIYESLESLITRNVQTANYILENYNYLIGN